MNSSLKCHGPCTAHSELRGDYCAKCAPVPENVKANWRAAIQAIQEVKQGASIPDRTWDRYLDTRVAFMKAREEEAARPQRTRRPDPNDLCRGCGWERCLHDADGCRNDGRCAGFREPDPTPEQVQVEIAREDASAKGLIARLYGEGHAGRHEGPGGQG